MKRALFIAWFLIHALPVTAQNRFGNEWINDNQRYLKVDINQAGIYRLTYQDVKAADAALAQTNPTHWQLFFRGQEVAIRVVGQQDGVFDSGDYVEFYGEGNDGSQDSLLYRPQQRLHPYQTLYSDVSAYFLTSSPTQTGKRVTELNSPTQGLTPEPFHVEETVQAFTSEYTFNNQKGLEPPLQQSYFEPGEGWSGRILTADSIGVVRLNVINRVATNWPIRLDGMINGRDNLFHRIQVQLDTNSRPFVQLPDFFGFISQSFRGQIDPSSIRNNLLTVRFKPDKNSGINHFSITYVKLSYPQAFDMAGQPAKVFHVPALTHLTALLSIQGAPPTAFAYDITDKANCRYVTTQHRDGQTQVVVTETVRQRDILLTNQLLKPLGIRPVRFSSTFPKETNYLIVTHSSLNASAATYAAYRASPAGGNKKPLVVDADSLYDQFNYGERSPLALRRFADYMLANTAAKNMLLLGKACSYPYFVKTAPDDLVPTIGYPGSDILLTAGLNGYPANTPAIPTGRLNVTTNEQVLTYLAKVKQQEGATPNGLWRKHIVHISGGKSAPEAQSLRSTMSVLGDILRQGVLGGTVSAFSKSNPYEEIESVNITPLVNEGVSLITFLGHAGPAITDMNFGFASPPQSGLRNQLYPLMIFNGCGVGEIFSRFNTLSTDWLLAPEKGSAVVLAHSYYSYEESTTRYMTKLYGDLFANPTTLGMPFGAVQQQLNSALEKEGVGPHDIAVLLQMVLQGDPALRVYPLPNPDFSVEQPGLYIQSSVAGSSLKSSDSIRVIVPMANLGRFVADQPVSVAIRQVNGTSTTSNTIRIDAFRYRDTLVYTIPKNEALQKIDVTIDPDNQLTELSRTNNTATLSIDWAQAGASSSYPPNRLPDAISPAINVLIDGAVRENRAVVNTTPRVDVFVVDENPLSAGDRNAVDVYLAPCDTCSPQKIAPESLTIVAISANQLQVTTQLALKAGGTYQLVILGKDAAGNQTQPPYTLDLSVAGADEPVTFRMYPNPASTYARFELNLNTQTLPTESKLTIYNLLGVRIFEDSFPIATGRNSLLWQAKNPGLYPYTLKLTWKDGRTETHTGKVIWQR